MQALFDSISLWITLVVAIASFWISFELGYRRGHRRAPADQDEKSQVSMVVAGLLGLVGLLLAFSFSIVEARLQARNTLVVDDANAIRTAFLRAGAIPKPHGAIVRDLLREYIADRLDVTPGNFKERLRQFARLHHDLWIQANSVADQYPNSDVVALFVESINEVINLAEQRLFTFLHRRLPLAVFGALFVVSLLALGGLGYSSGLTHSRAVVPTFVLILAIGIFEVLIVDLDRPLTRFSQISQEAMVDVKESMSRF
jgi:hypothetical protein